MAIDEFIVRSVTLEKTIGRVKQNLDFKRESFFQLEISSPFILRGISFHIFVRAFPRVPFSPILLGARGIKQTFKTLNFFFAHRARISFLLTFVYNFFLYFSTEVWQKTNHRQSLPRKCWTCTDVQIFDEASLFRFCNPSANALQQTTGGRDSIAYIRLSKFQKQLNLQPA